MKKAFGKYLLGFHDNNLNKQKNRLLYRKNMKEETLNRIVEKKIKEIRSTPYDKNIMNTLYRKGSLFLMLWGINETQETASYSCSKFEFMFNPETDIRESEKAVEEKVEKFFIVEEDDSFKEFTREEVISLLKVKTS